MDWTGQHSLLDYRSLLMQCNIIGIFIMYILYCVFLIYYNIIVILKVEYLYKYDEIL